MISNNCLFSLQLTIVFFVILAFANLNFDDNAIIYHCLLLCKFCLIFWMKLLAWLMVSFIFLAADFSLLLIIFLICSQVLLIGSPALLFPFWQGLESELLSLWLESLQSVRYVCFCRAFFRKTLSRYSLFFFSNSLSLRDISVVSVIFYGS